MNCLEFRRSCSTEPGRESPERDGHASECGSCAAFAVEMESFDQLLTEALHLPVPANIRNFSVDDARVRVAAPPGRATGWLGRVAIAASIVAAVMVSFGAWRVATAPDLGSELVAHVRHEPASLMPVADPVSVDNMNLVLQRTGVRVDSPLGIVTYIKSCPFRNREVAHVVIEGSTGPVTLMLLPHVTVEQATPIDEDGFKGTIIPVGKGSVAIIGGETEPLEPVEELVSSAVAWQI